MSDIIYTYVDEALGIPRSCGTVDIAPPGCRAIPGVWRADRWRMDAAGQWQPYQPPAPPDDDARTWVWDAEAWTWTPQPTTQALAHEARDRRAALLAACDWTQLPDVPDSTRLLWTLYRQALRDITHQPGFPVQIQWPEPPA